MGRGLGWSSRILILSPQCFMLKWERKPFHVWEEPGHPVKGKGHRFVNRRKLALYTWGWCNVWLTGSWLQYIAGLVLFMRQRCAVMEPALRSTPHSGHGIRLRIPAWYESPTPVCFSAMASYDIPIRNVPVCHVIVHDLATMAAIPYLLKRPTRTLISCCIQSKLHGLTMP